MASTGEIASWTILGILGLIAIYFIGNDLFEKKFAGVVKVEDPQKAEKIAEAWRIITEDKLGGVLCTFFILIAAIIPIIFFASGFFTDTVNQSWDYSKGGVVGLGALLALFGLTSTAFADFSKKLIGWMGSFSVRVPDPADAAKTITNWWGVAKWILIGGGVIAATTATGLLSKGESGWVGYVVALVPVIALILAGNGYLGKFSTAPGAAQAGGGALMVDPYPEGLCDVPGFGWAANSVAPASIVLTQSIAWYYLIKHFSMQSGNSVAIGATSAAVFLLQWGALYAKGCLESYSAGTWAPLIAYVISIAFGSIGYFADKNITSGASSSGGSVKPTPTPDGLICPKGYTMNPSGNCVKRLGPGGTKFEIPIAIGAEQSTSEPVDESQDAFVCEAYKDGELITSTIVD